MSDQPQNLGVLYIVSGDKYLRAAIHSARSVRLHEPGLPIHLFTADPNSPILAAAQGVFDGIDKIENPHRRSKLEYFAKSPFERTLYLDSDTELVAPIRQMFGILDRFDMALCHAHWRNHPVTSQVWKTKLPYSYPQFNSGVMLYKRNEKTDRFFKEWQQNFAAAGLPQDQVTLRETMWASDVRLYTLPPEYNIRFWKYLKLWEKGEVEPRILHMQKFHDGPLWFVKNWIKGFARGVLGLFGLKPSSFRR